LDAGHVLRDAVGMMNLRPDAAAASSDRPFVVTIVLNTNRKNDTLECLRSLATQEPGSDNLVMVLDNKSSDGSAEAIRGAFPTTVIVAIDGDRGYAGNNNVGIKLAVARRPDWILILNEDTVLDSACLTRMIAAGESEASIGMVGPLVLHHDEPNVIQSAGGQLGRYWESVHIGANDIDRGRFDRVQDVDWISGCALLVRRAVVEQVGMLDERFYYYWEETEWCVRTRKAGWRIVHAPDAKLWHKGVRRDYVATANVTYYNTRNKFLLMSIHRAPLSVWVVTSWQTARTLLAWTLRCRWRSLTEHRRAMRQGVIDFVLGHWGARSS
jgi:GT2 family glycosyltransferase